MDPERSRPSRRGAVKLLLGLAGAAAFGAGAQAKVAKSAVQYQDKPKNGQRCSDCVHFVPADQCKIVEGTISPGGWCMAYSKR